MPDSGVGATGRVEAVRPADTSPEAWQVQRALHRAMTGEQRLALALEMADEVVRISEAGRAFRADEAVRTAE